jgi:hypothetical protein
MYLLSGENCGLDTCIVSPAGLVVESAGLVVVSPGMVVASSGFVVESPALAASTALAGSLSDKATNFIRAISTR